MQLLPVKEIAHKLIDSLPDGVTFEDVMHALYVQSKFDKGEREIESGRGIKHSEAKKSFEKWLK